MSNVEKLSIHKLMIPQGEWKGPQEGQRYYNGADVSKTGALVLDESGWPVAAVQPKMFRPETTYPVDKKSVLENGYIPEDAQHHEPITDVSTLTTGSEVEISIRSKNNETQYRITPDTLNRVKQLGEETGVGGYSTYEVRDDMLEANRPVVKATFKDVVHAAREQNRILTKVADETNTHLTFDSSASIADPDVDFPDDPYVRAMVDVLATKFLSTDKRKLAWTATVSSEMLNGQNCEPLDHRKVAQEMDNLEFSRNMIREFCCKAHHIHLGKEHANPNFYAFTLNNVMGGIGLPRSIASFSGPFKNGHYMCLNEVKQIQRVSFKTAGFQPAYKEMGSDEANAEIYRNLTEGEAASLTRAWITDNKAHGNSRIRTEKTLRTAELLFPSTHPLVEVEAAQVMSYAYDMAILSHYYSGNGVSGEIPQDARRFYAEPDEKRFNRNRIQAGVKGLYAKIIDGLNQEVPYAKYMQDYTEFIKKELKRLNIETPEGEVDQVTEWLLKSTQKPSEWNIVNYLNPDHPDFGVGCLTSHMIGELSARINGEQARTLPGEELRRSVKTGIYTDEITDITSKFSEAVHNLYGSKNSGVIYEKN